jgi:MFS family permease
MAVSLGAVFTSFIGLFGPTPLYPEVAHDLGVGPDQFGAFFLIQGGISFLLQLPAGMLSDRIGRRPLITIGILCMAVGQALRWWPGQGALTFGAGQLFIGLSSPFAVAASYALVADAYRGGGRAQAIGTLQAAANAGMASGLVLAGLISPALGWRGYSLAVGLATLVVLPLAATAKDPPPATSAAPATIEGRPRVGLTGDRRARLIGLSGVLVLMAWGGSLFLLPFVARAHSIGEVGGSLLLAPNLVGSFIGGIAAGRWADRAGARAPAVVTALAGTVALVALALAPFMPWLVAIAGVLVGAAVSGAIAIGAFALVEGANRRGGGTATALAILRTGQGLGAAVAPAVAGFALVHTSTETSYLLLAVCLAAAGGLLAANVTPGRGYDST